MAEEAKDAAAAPPPKKINLQLILVLVNFVALLGAIGTMVYTKLMFERPPITENQEIEKRKNEAKTPPPTEAAVIVALEELRINIASTSGKSHYVVFNMSLECQNDDAAASVKGKMALVTDKIISIFNRKQFTELNTIQGRLILKEQLLRELNELIGAGFIRNIYYSNFVLQ